MKLDAHVHTTHSGKATVYPFNHFMRESYNTPESVYATATERGMDLVTITDHDQISGALALGDRDDVLIGCEVTAEWPDIDLCVHINVFDITPAQHDEIQRLRVDVRQLMPYLHQQDIYCSLNHVASGSPGRSGADGCAVRSLPARAAFQSRFALRSDRASGDRRTSGSWPRRLTARLPVCLTA